MQTVKLSDWQIIAIETALIKMEISWKRDGVNGRGMNDLKELIALIEDTDTAAVSLRTPKMER